MSAQVDPSRVEQTHRHDVRPRRAVFGRLCGAFAGRADGKSKVSPEITFGTGAGAQAKPSQEDLVKGAKKIAATSVPRARVFLKVPLAGAGVAPSSSSHLEQCVARASLELEHGEVRTRRLVQVGTRDGRLLCEIDILDDRLARGVADALVQALLRDEDSSGIRAALFACGAVEGAPLEVAAAWPLELAQDRISRSFLTSVLPAQIVPALDEAFSLVSATWQTIEADAELDGSLPFLHRLSVFPSLWRFEDMRLLTFAQGLEEALLLDLWPLDFWPQRQTAGDQQCAPSSAQAMKVAVDEESLLADARAAHRQLKESFAAGTEWAARSHDFGADSDGLGRYLVLGMDHPLAPGAELYDPGVRSLIMVREMMAEASPPGIPHLMSPVGWQLSAEPHLSSLVLIFSSPALLVEALERLTARPESESLEVLSVKNRFRDPVCNGQRFVSIDVRQLLKPRPHVSELRLTLRGLISANAKAATTVEAACQAIWPSAEPKKLARMILSTFEETLGIAAQKSIRDLELLAQCLDPKDVEAQSHPTTEGGSAQRSALLAWAQRSNAYDEKVLDSLPLNVVHRAVLVGSLEGARRRLRLPAAPTNLEAEVRTMKLRLDELEQQHQELLLQQERGESLPTWLRPSLEQSSTAIASASAAPSLVSASSVRAVQRYKDGLPLGPTRLERITVPLCQSSVSSVTLPLVSPPEIAKATIRSFGAAGTAASAAGAAGWCRVSYSSAGAAAIDLLLEGGGGGPVFVAKLQSGGQAQAAGVAPGFRLLALNGDKQGFETAPGAELLPTLLRLRHGEVTMEFLNSAPQVHGLRSLGDAMARQGLSTRPAFVD